METVVSLLVLIGSAFGLLAAIGVVRFPDCYCRLHAATKAGAFGGSLLALAVGIFFSTFGAWLEAILLVVFFYTTMPVSAHLIARASRRAGIEPVKNTSVEALEVFELENQDK
ncbi:MAG: monovalent cation/H(+) antiporter subunit G [Verrucomicrobiota bacterium]